MFLRSIPVLVVSVFLFLNAFPIAGYADEAIEAEALESAVSEDVDLVASENEAQGTGPENVEDVSENNEKSEQEAFSDSEEPTEGAASGNRPLSQDVVGKSRQVAEYAGTSGELRYSVDIAMPKFRGLEPQVSLAYNSHFSGKSGAQAVMGPGWQLRGFSSIERVSARRGVPTYQSGRDIFLLDGEELLKCDSTPLVISQTTVEYAPSHIATNSDPGCDASGDFTAREGAYARIKYFAEDHLFEVTQKDGTKYIYHSINVLVPEEVHLGEQHARAKYRRKWLLTRIEDTQEDKNAVHFHYDFDTVGHVSSSLGFPEKLVQINYAGYKIDFQYAKQQYPVAAFSTGTKYRGQQFHLLETITIARWEGEQKIRAYDLKYEVSPFLGTKRLVKIKPFGNDYLVQGDGIQPTAEGPELPSHEFEYNDDTFTTQKRMYDQFEDYTDPPNAHAGLYKDWNTETTIHPSDPDLVQTFHTKLRVVETNGDGIDELLALDYRPNNWKRNYYRERSGHYVFDLDGNLSKNDASFAIPAGNFVEGTTYYQKPGYEAFLGMSRWLPNNTEVKAVRAKMTYATRRHLTLNPLSREDLNHPFLEVDAAQSKDQIHWLYGNFDEDPGMEVMVWRQLFDVGVVSDDPAERFPEKQITINGPHDCSVRTWTNARVVDVNADGIDDVIFRANYDGHVNQFCLRIVTPDGFEDSVHATRQVLDVTANLQSEEPVFKWAYGFGDVNGDGIPDSIRYGNVRHSDYDRDANPKWAPYDLENLDVTVAFGNGDGSFSSRETWLENIDFREGYASSHFTYGASVVTADLNADGLSDIILHSGYYEGGSPIQWPDTSGPVRVFLSTGSGFVEHLLHPSAHQGRYAAVGDFNGNGLKDLAFNAQPAGDQRARVFFATGEVGHRIKKITTNLGEVVDVTYKPSTHFPDDHTPYVRQLVHTVTSDLGIGNTRTVEFSYKNGRYDFDERRPLGFEEIQIKFPRVDGEAEDLVQITNYLTGHIAEVGLIEQQYTKYGETTYSHTENTWDVVKTGVGPYRALKIRERNGVRYGTNILYRTKKFTYNQYNELLTEVDFGFDGPEDDVATGYIYVPNLDDYIVNKVAQRVVQKGDTVSMAPNANWLSADMFAYDGNSWDWLPTRGNLTQHLRWNGSLSGNLADGIAEMDYDAFGNVVAKRNALGHQTSYTFTGPRSLFAESVSNAKGHTTSTTWDYACQKPLILTDPNNLVTEFTYDKHCREVKKRVIWQTSGVDEAQEYRTVYQNFGDPGGQYVMKSQKSSNTDSGQLWQYSRFYFDGLGQIYKETKSGAVSTVLAASVTVRRFDERGQLEWESIPLSWSDAADNYATSGERTRFSYDPLGRMTSSVFADGSQMSMAYRSYSRTLWGRTAIYPDVYTKGEGCFSSVPRAICDETIEVTDAFGNLVMRRKLDRAGSDFDHVSGTGRNTIFQYDGLKRLTKIQDPAGLMFEFKYDSFGNKVEQSDPGLGRWKMSYYADGSLKQQIDAKGQEIFFWYDELGRVTQKRVQQKNDNGEHVSYSNTYSWYDGDDNWMPAGFAYTGFLTKQQAFDGEGWQHTATYRYDQKGNLIWNGSWFGAGAYKWEARYTVSDQLLTQTYLNEPGNGDSRAWTPWLKYDTADRPVALGTYFTGSTYDLWGNLTDRQYDSGARLVSSFDPQRGWVDSIRHIAQDGSTIADAYYTRGPAGRVLSMITNDRHSNGAIDHYNVEYSYDYAGRLTKVEHVGSNASLADGIDQTFTYDSAGRMRFNSRVGSYSYPVETEVGTNGYSIHGHAPTSVQLIGNGGLQTLEYDANGNMTRGLDTAASTGGKVITYDGENRPLTVEYQGNTTKYVYAADGTRLKKTEKFGTSANTTTAYIKGVEIRKLGEGAGEILVSHLTDDVRFTFGGADPFRKDFLHHDQLGSVIGVSNASGATALRSTYRAFGEKNVDRQFDLTISDETKGFIGERYDADAGLQYLNARYYDPELGAFIPQDPFKGQVQNGAMQ